MDQILGAPAAQASQRVTPQFQQKMEEPLDVTGAFHDRASLLKALIAVEALGAPPALRPRELRSDMW